jgi:hypothetical protein
MSDYVTCPYAHAVSAGTTTCPHCGAPIRAAGRTAGGRRPAPTWGAPAVVPPPPASSPGWIPPPRPAAAGTGSLPPDPAASGGAPPPGWGGGPGQPGPPGPAPAPKRGHKVRNVSAIVAVLVVVAIVASVAVKISKADSLKGDFEGLLHQSRIQVTLSVDNTPQQIVAATKGSASLAEARDLTSSRLVFNLSSGASQHLGDLNASDGATGQFSMAFQYATTTPVAIEYTGGSLYARLSLTALAKVPGITSKDVSGIHAAVEQAGTHVPGLSALADGQWVTIPHSELVAIEKLAKSPGKAVTTPAFSPAELVKLRNAAETAFASSVDFKDNGSSGGRHEYTLTAHIGTFVRDLAAQPAIKSAIAGAGGAGSRDLSKAADGVPAGTQGQVQIFAAHGKVVQIRVDLAQFGHSLAQPVYLSLGFAGGSKVAAPSGATTVDLKPFLKQLQKELQTPGGLTA